MCDNRAVLSDTLTTSYNLESSQPYPHRFPFSQQCTAIASSSTNDYEEDRIKLEPIDTINGDVVLPGSKSFSNRVVLLSALAQGTTLVENILHSEDTR